MQGAPVRLDLRPFDAPLAGIQRLEGEIQALADDELQQRAAWLRRQALSGVALAVLRTPMYALVREASRRTLGLRPFDVQIVAALALERGAVVEMQTGEGKTLAAVMPAALNALTGREVHILTFNDYLAGRDARWMGPVFRMLGLAVGCVQQGMPADQRRRAYAADVTYVTAKEAGFDWLRDGLASSPADLVHRPFHFAVVDEADSLMIDEARVPLVIAGGVDRSGPHAAPVAALVASLVPGVHFDTDEYGRDAELTEAGVDHVERALACGSLHEEGNYALLTAINCALHARVLLRRDVDYIIGTAVSGWSTSSPGASWTTGSGPTGCRRRSKRRRGWRGGTTEGSWLLSRSSAFSAAIRGCAG
ncbi:hypothetical protein BH24ACI4_BH24ACI4_33750 [soil metagenome]